jgi:hypothetical protein
MERDGDDIFDRTKVHEMAGLAAASRAAGTNDESVKILRNLTIPTAAAFFYAVHRYTAV